MHGLTPHEEILYWRERTMAAEARLAATRGVAISTAQDVQADRDSLREANQTLIGELARLRKHVDHNDEEYTTMKGVLRAEHEECQRLRGELARLGPVVEAAKAMLHAWRDVPPAHSYQRDTRAELSDAIDTLTTQAEEKP